MIAVPAPPEVFPCTPGDLLFGKAEVLAVIAANPKKPSYRARLRTTLLWNQLCRERPKGVQIAKSCIICRVGRRRNHGTHHYDSMVVSALSVLELKDAVLEADWKGFGDETAKDFLALCVLLKHRLCLD